MNERLLLQLPIPQKNRRGWPWSEETEIHCIDQNITYPKISIIVPSYNQCEFIEETIRSILLQNYPNLELIIIDGGSNDGTVDIIKRYDSWINYWISEDDKGQSYAINKGFQKVTGDWVGWQNSDERPRPSSTRSCATPPRAGWSPTSTSAPSCPAASTRAPSSP